MAQETVINFNETELVSQSLGGSLKAFSAIVEFYQERTIRLAYSFVGNWEDARDLAQEAFIKAYENLKSYKAESRFYTWLYRILVNKCKDFLRKKKVRGFISLWSAGPEEDESEESPEARVADSAPTALEELQRKELGERIHGVIQKLPFQQRSVFSLRYLEGLSLGEIAETMTLSTGAVKAHLWQAGQKFRKEMQGGC